MFPTTSSETRAARRQRKVLERCETKEKKKERGGNAGAAPPGRPLAICRPAERIISISSLVFLRERERERGREEHV
jgi:hypothetical protein